MTHGPPDAFFSDAWPFETPRQRAARIVKERLAQYPGITREEAEYGADDPAAWEREVVAWCEMGNTIPPAFLSRLTREEYLGLLRVTRHAPRAIPTGYQHPSMRSGD